MSRETQRTGRRWVVSAPLLGTLVALGACQAGSDAVSIGGGGDAAELTCSIDRAQILNGGPGKDGIPALSNPATTTSFDVGAGYLLDEDRIIGLEVGGEVLAVPINILWWHEIVNLELGGKTLAVTHCPLTGSSMAFDRALHDGAEFGVSGLLYRNNLIMYDRRTDESLWPQMSRGARCGVRDGTGLEMFPVVEMTWGAWRTLYPNTLVVSSETGFDRDYRVYPYGDYDRIDNPQLLFPLVGIDGRRPPKERVLGIPFGEGGVAYPFGELAALGSVGTVAVDESVVFWEKRGEAAMAFSRTLDGELLDFTVAFGAITDAQTGSTWMVDGSAVTGPLAGRRLEAVAEAYVAYWFAWAVFQPQTTLWSAP